jgi:1-deoxy-D-xylulose-5-phosphate reductoisomerase
VQIDSVDLVLTAMVGYAGLKPTIAAIQAGKDIALANKETLVVAGSLVIKLARRHQVRILPVDSEHSAIYQCLVGEGFNQIEKIFLTASGGPFREMDINSLKKVTPEEALNHPNWEMGAKITIDSASLMNKGFEAIEAKWLFSLEPHQIKVLIHPQSIIHSMVQFEDGSIKAQMGLPDMKLPILYAMSFPERIKSDFPRLHFADYPQLTFEETDFKKFPCLGLAYRALEAGGNIPCILNASNEIVVHAFLNNKIRFVDIPEIISKTIDRINFISEPDLEDLEKTDKESRHLTMVFING